MKHILLFAVLIIGLNSYSQQIEIGPTLGYWSSNIANYNIENNRSVIGKSIWNPIFGLSAIYYFKKPNEVVTGRIGILYKHSKKGSVSEISDDNKFEFSTNIFGVTGGIARDIGKGFVLYIDIGFSYNIIDNTMPYKGNRPQLEVFPKLEEKLIVKKNEFGFLYAFGLEKAINKNFKLFFELNGDAGISKINKNDGNLRTQSIGFGIGIRYIFNLNK